MNIEICLIVIRPIKTTIIQINSVFHKATFPYNIYHIISLCNILMDYFLYDFLYTYCIIVHNALGCIEAAYAVLRGFGGPDKQMRNIYRPDKPEAEPPTGPVCPAGQKSVNSPVMRCFECPVAIGDFNHEQHSMFYTLIHASQNASVVSRLVL
jgi:hypothetical protein